MRDIPPLHMTPDLTPFSPLPHTDAGLCPQLVRPHTSPDMATIADELLNDFESDEEEQEEEQNDAFLADGGNTEMPTTGLTMPTGAYQANGSMELEGDEEEPDDADMEGTVPDHIKMERQEDEEETKARVEKMQLQKVTDVRSVAGLMKLLQPVIEVSPHSPLRFVATIIIYSS